MIEIFKKEESSSAKYKNSIYEMNEEIARIEGLINETTDDLLTEALIYELLSAMQRRRLYIQEIKEKFSKEKEEL